MRQMALYTLLLLAGSICAEDSHPEETLLFGKTSVRIINNAPKDALGPNHPLVIAEAEGCIGWIHFVCVNRDPGIIHSRQFGDDRLFVDILPGQQEQRNPFYSYGKMFFDNPLWGKPAEGRLVWIGSAFPIICENDERSIGLGFRWGFSWDSSQAFPTALPVTKIDPLMFRMFSAPFEKDFDFPPVGEAFGRDD